jgi:hypothetical protein
MSRDPRARLALGFVRTGLVGLLGLGLLGCTRDLSERPILPPASASSEENGAAADRVAVDRAPPWLPERCHLPPETGALDGRGLLVSGACDLALAAPAICHAQEDDFYVVVERALSGGRIFHLYVNVERYHGTGDYRGLAQIHASVREGQALYRWTSFQGTVSLAGDEAARTVHISAATLPAEPGTPASGTILADGTLACRP